MYAGIILIIVLTAAYFVIGIGSAIVAKFLLQGGKNLNIYNVVGIVLSGPAFLIISTVDMVYDAVLKIKLTKDSKELKEKIDESFNL